MLYMYIYIVYQYTHHAMLQNIYQSYLIFLIYLVPLYLLPTQKSRHIYLYSVSVSVLVWADGIIKIALVVAILHSLIHNIWKFLSYENGYDNNINTCYDVLCHTLMLVFSCGYVSSQMPLGQATYFNMCTWVFTIGCIVNCFASMYKKKLDMYALFKYTSVFQAISTGCWIATLVWYGNNLPYNNYFMLHFAAWILLMTANWFTYLNNIHVLRISMKYKYIEAVFIVACWVAHANVFMYRDTKLVN